MLKLISRIILIVKGWTYNVDAVKQLDKCVLIVVPHTSAWDMVLGKSVFVLSGIPAKIAIKKEAFFWPMNWLLRYLGAIPIDRTPKKGDTNRLSLVDAMANSIKKEKLVCMVIAPEGTRGKRKQWKTGFYHIALNANVPIALGYLDFEVKEAIINKVIYPSGDMEKDMREIMDYFKDKVHLGKYPNRSTVDERWS
ncbi:MAG TPA: 1-acyl-sn-glycerol-3-phosphate acyltransferase [Chitinophagales bacterium]|jgi:1-acyl-sn-glycerol-3-phosphate acyltransferase|nr:1-acyl-sn-glycerol-3-phosphate acyltransferase [Chitinophagales bacterium]MBP6154799.1 1-acyl-sn-glycerol-3-phosphate acyltransferase [Chitinophagales bacterium]HQV76863.1 1-acyl-sn-glycerol-3-phosphate acyltransferase [Chitinophagales bacterium]HQW78070.1 1-acyl-sn-glycerol-3-phosphate acyltransferase [Chitinophagales bacterium]HRB67001.1 1-acyl-sn-glycerol-3-phosphate acyltransferase [Chitinophagales bacterium]